MRLDQYYEKGGGVMLFCKSSKCIPHLLFNYLVVNFLGINK